MCPYLTKLQVAKFVHKQKHKKAWFKNHALSHSSVTYRKILYGDYGNPESFLSLETATL